MPWKKGQSGNPKGRAKKGQCYADMLEKAVKDLVARQPGEDGKTKIYKGKLVLAKAVVELATNPSYPPQVRLTAIKEIFDRTDGKAPQYLDMMAQVEQSGGQELHVFVNDLEPDKEG